MIVNPSSIQRESLQITHKSDSNMTVVEPIRFNIATLPTSRQKELIPESEKKTISSKPHVPNPFLFKDFITSSYPIDNQPSIYFLSHIMIDLYEKCGCKITTNLKKPLSHPLLAFPTIIMNCLLSFNLNCLQEAFRAYSFPQSWIKLQDNFFQIHQDNYLMNKVTLLFQNFPDARIALINQPEYVVIEHRPNKHSDEIIYQRAIQCSFQFVGVRIPPNICTTGTFLETNLLEIKVEGTCLLYIHNLQQSNSMPDQHMNNLDLFYDLIEGVDLQWKLVSMQDFQLLDEP